MAVYYVYSGAAGSNNGSSWANAFTTLTTAFATEAAGDTLYVAHDHAESTAAAVTLVSSGTAASITKIICVDRGGTVPPVSADRRTTALVTITGNNDMTINGVAHFDGIIFRRTTGTAGSIFLGTATNSAQRYDNCSFRLDSTGGNICAGGTATAGAAIELNNTTLSFASTSQGLIVTSLCKWRNTASAILGTIPTVLIQFSSGRGVLLECVGIDFSAVGSGKTLCDQNNISGGAARFLDCKLNALVTKAITQTQKGNPEVDFVRSGSAGVNYTVYSMRHTAVLTEETTVVRIGGATDGTTSLAWKIVTTANCNYSTPFECPLIAVWNDTTGSSVTATVEGIWGGGAVPNDDDIWLDVEYLGDASSPQGSFVNDGKVDLLATAAGQASSSEVWGGSTTKFKLSISFTPQQKGWVFGRVKCAKASSTFYIDPVVTLAATVVTYPTWDPATVTAVTLSNGNLTATNTGTTSGDQGARVAASAGKTSGKYYYEVTLVTETGGGNAGYGAATTASTYTAMGNNATAGVECYLNGGIYANSTNTGLQVFNPVNGHVIGIAVDLDNRKAWFRNWMTTPPGASNDGWNGVLSTSSQNPATNTGGVTVPAGTIVPLCTFGGSGGAAGNVYTANFGASAFTGAVPSGFTSGWPI